MSATDRQLEPCPEAFKHEAIADLLLRRYSRYCRRVSTHTGFNVFAL